MTKCLWYFQERQQERSPAVSCAFQMPQSSFGNLSGHACHVSVQAENHYPLWKLLVSRISWFKNKQNSSFWTYDTILGPLIYKIMKVLIMMIAVPYHGIRISWALFGHEGRGKMDFFGNLLSSILNFRSEEISPCTLSRLHPLPFSPNAGCSFVRFSRKFPEPFKPLIPVVSPAATTHT